MRCAALVVILAACSPAVTTSVGDDAGGDDDRVDARPPPGGGAPDATCGTTELAIAAVAPNLLVMLDRSCSMTDPASSSGGAAKWDVAVGAINQVVTAHAGDIRWGLGLFPDLIDPDCRQGTADDRSVPIRVDAGTAGAIDTLLSAALDPGDPYYPDHPCVTNIDWAMKQASLQPELDDPARTSDVMLVTDGKQADCDGAGGDAGTEDIITTLWTTRGIGTFVVGFGAEVDPDELNRLAMFGGHARPASPAYYQANNAAELDAALTAIARATIQCELAVTDPPADPDRIWVYVNDTTLVPRDPTHTTGWDYDPATMTLTFYGATCDALKTGVYTDIDLVEGCPAPVID